MTAARWRAFRRVLKKVGGDCGRSRGGRGEGGVGKSTRGEEGDRGDVGGVMAHLWFLFEMPFQQLDASSLKVFCVCVCV